MKFKKILSLFIASTVFTTLSVYAQDFKKISFVTSDADSVQVRLKTEKPSLVVHERARGDKKKLLKKLRMPQEKLVKKLKKLRQGRPTMMKMLLVMELKRQL